MLILGTKKNPIIMYFRYPMFPFHEDKIKYDDYGELIRYEDFMDIRNEIILWIYFVGVYIFFIIYNLEIFL